MESIGLFYSILDVYFLVRNLITLLNVLSINYELKGEIRYWSTLGFRLIV